MTAALNKILQDELTMNMLRNGSLGMPALNGIVLALLEHYAASNVEVGTAGDEPDEEDLPEGIYNADSLDDEYEVAQVNAIRKSYRKLRMGNLQPEDFLFINNQDFCDARIDLMNAMVRKGEVHVECALMLELEEGGESLQTYDLNCVQINKVDVWLANDGIGAFIKRSDLNDFLVGKE